MEVEIKETVTAYINTFSSKRPMGLNGYPSNKITLQWAAQSNKVLTIFERKLIVLSFRDSFYLNVQV